MCPYGFGLANFWLHIAYLSVLNSSSEAVRNSTFETVLILKVDLSTRYSNSLHIADFGGIEKTVKLHFCGVTVH